MLVQNFDFLVAEYNRLGAIDKAEIDQADVVLIRGNVPGGIYHPTHARWLGNIRGFENPKSFIRSKKEQRSVDKSRHYFEDQGYEFKLVPMTEALYLQFARLYEETTMAKERAVRYEIEKVLNGIRQGSPRYLVGMFKKRKLMSALLFMVGSDGQVLVSYGAKQKFDQTRGGVGGVLEMELLNYCFANGIEEISHGKSPNPAGVSGASGIFEFKTRYGYTAYPTGHWQTMFIKNRKVAMSDLVFVTAIDGNVGYLVVSDKDEKSVVGKYKSREVDCIKVVGFDDMIDAHTKALEELI